MKCLMALIFIFSSSAKATILRQNLGEYYADAVEQTAILEKLLVESQIDDIVTRHKSTKNLQHKLDLAETNILRLRIYIDKEVKSESPEFQEETTRLFGQTADTLSDLVTNRWGADALSPSDANELLFKFGRIIDQLFATERAHRIIMKIAKKQVERLSRMFHRSSEEKFFDGLQSVVMGPDTPSLMGALLMGSGLSVGHVASGLGLIILSQAYKFREKKISINQYKLLTALVVKDRTTFCKISLSLE